MTSLLQKAISKASLLPEETQDALAALLIEEMKSESRWDELFSGSAPTLEKLAEEALQEHQLGKTIPLDPDSL